MKNLLCLLVLVLVFAVRLDADENEVAKPRVVPMSEADVENELKADKAIAISKATAKLLLQKDSKLESEKACLKFLFPVQGVSAENRAFQSFVVKHKGEVKLYATPETLNRLKFCKVL